METLSPSRAVRRLSSVDRAIMISLVSMATFNLLAAASQLIAGSV